MSERTSQKPQPVYVVNPPRKRRRQTCLLWTLTAGFGLLVAVLIVVSSAYAGWNSGVHGARANATGTAQAGLQEQCDLLARNLLESQLDLALSRIAWLRRIQPVPDCLLASAPTATAAFLLAQPSPTAAPTQTPVPTTPPATATEVPLVLEPAATEIHGDAWDYDLAALLADATRDLQERNFSAAIDTLEAIVSIDDSYQREPVRGMLLDALTAQALALYRSFKLSEAIVLTERAEAYGDIGELNYERYIAEVFLIGRHYKTTNPAEAVRRFSEIVYQHNRNYMNGQVVGELQDALRYYADALLLQGEACRAQEQYAAALELHPNYSPVSRGVLTTKQTEAAQACGALPLQDGGQTASVPVGPTSPVGVRDSRNVGQSN